MGLRLVAVAVLLAGCGTMSVSHETRAVRDFVAVSDLEQVENIRLYRQLRYGYVTDYFVIVGVMKRHYLVEFAIRCRALRSKTFTAAMVDHRYDPAYLREYDTIRGCPVKRIYTGTNAQIKEVKELGKSIRTGAVVPAQVESASTEEIGSDR